MINNFTVNGRIIDSTINGRITYRGAVSCSTSRDMSINGRITISELFPCYKNALKWGKLTKPEDVRLVKEYTICTVTPQTTEWKVEGKRHRIDGPAYIIYYESGEKRHESWWIEGKLHRFDGPAQISYYENGKKWYEDWWVEDKLHRIDGPALIGYYESGENCMNHGMKKVKNTLKQSKIDI